MSRLRGWLRARRRQTAGPDQGDAPDLTLLPPPVCAAGPTLTDPVRQRELAEWGFTVVPFLDEEALATCRRLAEEVGPAPDDPRVALNWSFHSRSAEHKHAVGRVGQVAEPLLASTFVDHVAYLTTFITKWPGPSSGFPPHQDPSLVDERRFTGVTVWVPLVDVDQANGMLHVIPGSHRFESCLRAHDVDLTPFAHLEADMLEQHGRGVPLAAGEAMVFDNRLVHYSLPNASERERVVLSLGVRPRIARCLVARHQEDGRLALHEVDDGFYTEVVPAARHHWQPTRPPLAVVDGHRPTWDAERLDGWCGAVGGPAPRTSPPGQVDLSTALEGAVFCALCGSSDGLRPDARTGRNNAQLVCPSCADRVDIVAAGG